jgi:copper homeostasis protein
MIKLQTLEICIESLETGITATKAGADRLEVNSALALGGLTPSTSLVKLLRYQTNLPLIAMIRPRAGYFTYSKYELLQMQREAEALLEFGIEGIAFGFIDNDGNIDRTRTAIMVKVAAQRETVFHRAFDLMPNYLENMQILANIGITRILTSGCKKTAYEGRYIIKDLIKQAGDKIEILPAGGIRPDNAEKFINTTATRQIHSSCLIKRRDNFIYNGDISFIAPNIKDAEIPDIDTQKIRDLSNLKLI